MHLSRKHWLKIFLIAAVPLTLYFILREQASWRPIPLRIHQDSITALEFSPNGETLATISENTLRLWNLRTRTVEHTLDHTAALTSVGFSPDGNYVFTGTAKGRIHIWNAHTRQLERIFPTLGWQVRIHFSPDGKRLIDSGGQVWLWSASGGPFKRVLNLNQTHIFKLFGGINSVALAGDNQTLVTSSHFYNPRILFWNIRNGRLLRVLKLQNDRNNQLTVRTVVISPDAKVLAGLSAFYHDIYLWSATNGELLRSISIPPSRSYIMALSFSPDSSTLATGSNNGTVQLWRIK